ncbi:hypothetical protein KFL_010930050 [Klebsormidium nitens]|uniref:Uncharacterized protein n=1 Tax=Klebsormidium nitens TaxID=105231 RepID=A0A1Y1IP55_KLENI|nr:hypothetical protein KFL_010930050 [Klebsormidium nitens]|eukprot:GAQ92685.1 hypothetical protein KFL_010930050 [Klebsormidium nitens]
MSDAVCSPAAKVTVKEVRHGPNNGVTVITEYEHPSTGTFWENAHNAVVRQADLRSDRLPVGTPFGVADVSIGSGRRGNHRGIDRWRLVRRSGGFGKVTLLSLGATPGFAKGELPSELVAWDAVEVDADVSNKSEDGSSELGSDDPLSSEIATGGAVEVSDDVSGESTGGPSGSGSPPGPPGSASVVRQSGASIWYTTGSVSVCATGAWAAWCSWYLAKRVISSEVSSTKSSVDGAVPVRLEGPASSEWTFPRRSLSASKGLPPVGTLREEVDLPGGPLHGSLAVLNLHGALGQGDPPMEKQGKCAPAAAPVLDRQCCPFCVRGCRGPPCSFAKAQHKTIPKNPVPLIPGRPPERWDH